MNRSQNRLAAAALIALASTLTGLHGVSAQPAPAAPVTAPAPPPPGDAVRGKSAFMRFGCYECHGTLGQGNYGSGVKLAPKPLPYSALNNYVRRPAGNMPSFSTVILPDAVLADIYAYLASIPAGKTAAQIPILNDTTLKPK